MGIKISKRVDTETHTCNECGDELEVQAQRFGVITACHTCGVWSDEDGEQHELAARQLTVSI